MTKIGSHLKLTADPTHRATLARLFRDVLGATAATPAPHIDSFQFSEDSSVAIVYGKPDDALEESEQIKAPWLEFVVKDAAASTRSLAEMGVKPFDYFDKTHAYFRAPGGPVFRLAQG